MFLPRWAGMHGLAAQFGCSAWILAWACIGYLDWLGSTVKQPHSLFSPNKIASLDGPRNSSSGHWNYFIITEDWHFFGYKVLWRLAFICLFHLERYTPQPPREGQLRKNIAIGLGHIGRYGFYYFLYFLDGADLTLWRGRPAYLFLSF